MKSKFCVFIMLVILLSILSCSQESKPKFLTFQFDKHATLIVKPIRNGKNDSISGWYAPFLSPDYMNNYKTIKKVSKNENGEYVLNYDISCPSEVFFTVNQISRLPLFLIPDDTLHMTIDLSDSSNFLKSINFDGKFASINDYTIARHEKFKELFWKKSAALSRANLPVLKLQHSIDSITVKELDFLDKYLLKTTLPNWYLNYERNQINYRAAFDKTYQLSRLKWKNKDEKEPRNYSDFLDKIKINNNEAIISPNYYHFLNFYFHRFFNDGFYNLTVSKRRKVAGLRTLEISDSLLSGEIKNISNTYIISNFMIDMGLYQLSEEILSDTNGMISDSKYTTYLKKYLLDKSSLKVGVKAPEFYLFDTNNEYKSLSNYVGNVILLNFWYPGCKPCINEIPFEKQLVNNLKNENFKLINICLYNTEESWRNAINKLGVEGINLFANKNWQNKLMESYKLTGFPHYTLIDKDGSIISNTPKRPSDGVLEEILDLLEK